MIAGDTLRSNAGAHWEALLQETNFAKGHDVPCDFPVERPKKRKRRCDESREEGECLDGKERCKANAVMPVNQQMTSRFAE